MVRWFVFVAVTSLPLRRTYIGCTHVPITPAIVTTSKQNLWRVLCIGKLARPSRRVTFCHPQLVIFTSYKLGTIRGEISNATIFPSVMPVYTDLPDTTSFYFHALSDSVLKSFKEIDMDIGADSQPESPGIDSGTLSPDSAEQSLFDKQRTILQTYVDSVPYECESIEVMNEKLKGIIEKVLLCANVGDWVSLSHASNGLQ